MRCDQIIGLSGVATQLIEDNKVLTYTEVSTRYFVDGNVCKLEPKRFFDIQKKSYGHFYGMFDDKYDLLEYTLKDGSIVQEYVQETVWSSGPCIFLALRYRDSKETVKNTAWLQSEIFCNS